MPIGFARMQVLRRAAGHDPRQRYRYIARLGEYADRDDLALAPVTLTPPHAPRDLAGADLWSAVEAAARRKDAVVGAELVLSLPRFTELSLDAATGLLEAFCEALIVSHGLGATFVIHGIHDESAAQEDAAMAAESADGPSIAELLDTVLSWPHAHVLVTPRTLGPDGLSPSRCSILEPLVRGNAKNRTVLCAVPWAKIWTRSLNAALAHTGSGTRVRLKAPHAGRHVGPARALALLQSDIERGEAPEGQMWPRLNSKIEARNAETLAAAPELHEPVFTRAEVADLLSRYLDLAGPALAARTDQALEAIEARPLPDPLTGNPTGWLSSRDTLERARRIAGLAQSLAKDRAAPLLAEKAVTTTIARLERDPNLVPAIAGCLAHGQRLVTIEMGDFGSILPALDEIAAHAGAQVVHLGHKAMTLAALGRRRVRFVIPNQVEKKLGAENLVIVDRPDALELADLETLLNTAQQRDCRLLLVRRPHTLVFPRSPIIDRIAAQGPVHQLPASRTAILPSRMAPVDRELAALGDMLARGHAKVFENRAARLAYARRILNHPQPTNFFALAAADAHALGLDDLTPAASEATTANRSDAITMLLPDANRNTPLYSQSDPARTALLINAAQPPTLAHLIIATAHAAGDDRLFLAAAAFGAGELGFDAMDEIARVYVHHVRTIADAVRAKNPADTMGIAEALTMPIAALVDRLSPAPAHSVEPGADPDAPAGAFAFEPDDDPRPEDFSEADESYDDDPSPEPGEFEFDYADDDIPLLADEPSADFEPDIEDEPGTS